MRNSVNLKDSISNKLVVHRREASKMELVDVTNNVVANNAHPLTTIHITSPKGEPV
uniref:Uncharacterized protein n=1 Tax=Fagus sylvatica TaxID=28930 RepID=A0A2N9FPL3_FAGSY